MKEFILIFRTEPSPNVLTPEQMKQVTQPWQDWIGNLAAKGKLADTGARLGHDSAVVKTNDAVTNGPYAELKEILAGFTVIKAETLQEAIELTKGCPVFNVGGSVEVRDLIKMG